jgi:hypothetical protein
VLPTSFRSVGARLLSSIHALSLFAIEPGDVTAIGRFLTIHSQGGHARRSTHEPVEKGRSPKIIARLKSRVSRRLGRDRTGGTDNGRSSSRRCTCTCTSPLAMDKRLYDMNKMPFRQLGRNGQKWYNVTCHRWRILLNPPPWKNLSLDTCQ